MQRDQSISSRISRIVILAVAIGISVSVSAFLFSDFRQSIKAEASRYQSAAYAFAAAASDGVAERDTRKVLEVIRGVRDLPEVNYVAALEPNGNAFAEIGAGAHLVGSQSAGWSLFPTRIEVEAEVRKGGLSVGSIVMRADASGLTQRYLNAVLFAAVLGVVLVAATALMAKIYVGRAIRPLRNLSNEFLDIGQRTDLRRRIRKERNDEVGVLVDAFNEMFGHIDERDSLLQRHRETLEETVDARTKELRIAKDDADAANAAKSTFLATMSHEIRTPMNGMMVMAEMLSVAPLSPRHQRYAEIITRSGKNLLHIINDILDFSKIESGKIELEEIEFSLDAVIEDVACLFAERAREKGLSLSIYIAPDVPEKVVGDPVRLTQILSNLVNNGLKFTETGGVSVNASFSVEAGHFRIVVEDTGIGIAPDQISRIFTRFSQADSSITRKFGGTGLGLSISRQLSEIMEGTVHVESTLGQGSRFIVTIPLVVVEHSIPFAVSRPISLALHDDDIVSRRSICQAFEARGLSILPEGSVNCAAILVRAGCHPTIAQEARDLPAILLRPFAATSSIMPDGLSPAAEVPLPLSRRSLDLLCKAIDTGTLASLDLATSNRSAAEVPDLRHLKVLAVDDVAVNREVLAEALRTFNVECDLAESGLEAISKVRAKTYDVIFMDCSMPGMDGFEAAHQVRDIEKNTHRDPSLVIALTGHLMGRDGGAWKDAGMDSYLAKPFNIAQLRNIFSEFDILHPVGEDLLDDAVGPEDLLSSETLAMFESIRVATGTDIRGRVFGLFRDNAHGAFRLARDEITAGGSEGKRLIHALKSNCSSAGAGRATALCQRIEAVLELGEAIRPQQLQELEEILDFTIAAMNAMDHGSEKNAAWS